ncbi:MAG: hypothetical protein V1872_10960 [bacterium]
MEKKISYTDEPMELELVEDFLPPPDQLAIKDEDIKVTITLSKESIEFLASFIKRRK